MHIGPAVTLTPCQGGGAYTRVCTHLRRAFSFFCSYQVATVSSAKLLVVTPISSGVTKLLHAFRRTVNGGSEGLSECERACLANLY